MPGMFSPPPQIGDPDMHHGTCVTNVPWCMPGLLTNGFLWSRWWGKLPGIPGSCATRNFTYLVRGPWIADTKRCDIWPWQDLSEWLTIITYIILRIYFQNILYFVYSKTYNDCLDTKVYNIFSFIIMSLCGCPFYILDALSYHVLKPRLFLGWGKIKLTTGLFGNPSSGYLNGTRTYQDMQPKQLFIGLLIKNCWYLWFDGDNKIMYTYSHKHHKRIG